MRRLTLLGLLVSLLSACSSTETASPDSSAKPAVAGEAVDRESNFAPKGINPGFSW